MGALGRCRRVLEVAAVADSAESAMSKQRLRLVVSDGVSMWVVEAIMVRRGERAPGEGWRRGLLEGMIVQEMARARGQLRTEYVKAGQYASRLLSEGL